MTEKGLSNVVKELMVRGGHCNRGCHKENYVIEGIIISLESLGFRVNVTTKSGKYMVISIIDIDGYPLVTINYTTHQVIMFDYT